MEWAEVAVATTTCGSEAVGELLLRHGSEGTVFEDKNDLLQHDEHADWDYIDDAVYASYGEDVVVKGYFKKDEKLSDVLRAVREELRALKEESATWDGFDPGKLELTVENIREEDWANEWRKYYKPTRVSPRVVVVPSWEHYEAAEGDVILEMDPGMAFGTGTHETTRMCLKMADQYVHPGDTVIDVGCGSAILGIAAAKLGAKEVLAIDRDPVAVQSAVENIERNGVADRVRAVEGDLLAGQHRMQADVVLVNIIADVIIGLLPDLRPFVRPGTVVILSGIIKERLTDVTDAVANCGYTLLETDAQGEWTAAACRIG